MVKIVRVEEISEKLKVDKLAICSDEISTVGLEPDLAAELKELIYVLVPAESFQGYLAVDGQYVVFRRDSRKCVLAIVEEGRVRWCLRRLEEVLNGS